MIGAPVLTPHGLLILRPQADAPVLQPQQAARLGKAFARGTGHGLLALGADEVGTALPPVFSLYLHDRFGVTTDQIGYFFMVFGAVGVLMRIGPVGWFNAWLGEVRTMQVGVLFLFAGFVLVPLATSLPLFIAAQILLPLGTALLFPANSALVSHRAHHDEIGVTMGVQQTYRGVAAILGPVYAGGSYQLLGQHVPFYISAAIIIFVMYLTLRIHEDTPTPVALST